MLSPSELRKTIEVSGRSVASVAREAGIPKETLYSFMRKPSSRLRYDAHLAVMSVMKETESFSIKGLQERTTPFDADLPLAGEARELGLDPEAIATQAIEASVKRKRLDAWLEENASAFAANAKDIENNGLWSDRRRLF